MIGRTPYLQPVHLQAPGARPGALIDVRIEDAHAHSLAGAPVLSSATAVARHPGHEARA
jgi:hypothetical protein